MKEAKTGKKNELMSGYWLYSDGFAAWGIAMIRNDEFPIKIDRKVFELPIAEKLEYFVKTVEENRKAKEEAEKKEASKGSQYVATPKPAPVAPKKA